MKKIEPESLKQRIETYLERAKKNREKDVPYYPLDQVATYEIIGGYDLDWRRQVDNRFVTGKFIDALVYALHQPEFYATWCDDDDLNNCNHGFIRRMDDPVQTFSARQMLPTGDYFEIIKKYGREKK
ncbi:hypothetical protein JXB28_02340 [Candidatus Woesearchaeota archaeon]|nr:hypothetical protein [Candidatus Woesearchaeota archaeon]